MHDVNVLDLLLPEPGAYYVMDRGYLDFERSNLKAAMSGALKAAVSKATASR